MNFNIYAVRYFLVVLLLLSSQLLLAQSTQRLTIVTSKRASEKTQTFFINCLSGKYTDDLLPNDHYPKLDSAKHIKALLRLKPAIKLKEECDGIYYYLLRSGYWRTPTFRGNEGSYYEYEYLVILNNRITPFKAKDSENRRKFRNIRKELIKRIGTQKTDSIKPY